MKARILVLTTAFLAGATGIQAAPSVDEIVHRANRAAYYQGKDGRAEVRMTITDDQGRERERRMTLLRYDEADTDDLEDNAYRSPQKYYVYFHRPADLNRTVFMVWKHLEDQDDRWLYLSSLDLVRRISATDKRNSFVGSDFFYEDVSGRNIELDTHEKTGETEDYYILESTPKDPDAVRFARYESYIHKSSFIPIQVNYYKENDEKYREATALEVETIQGYPTVTRARMRSLEKGSETVMEYPNVEYDVGLPEDIFTERYLRRAPSKYLN
ncbi:MAG: outer membrane lipoprotein-sorting protein [Opitutales bacterium]